MCLQSHMRYHHNYISDRAEARSNHQTTDFAIYIYIYIYTYIYINCLYLKIKYRYSEFHVLSRRSSGDFVHDFLLTYTNNIYRLALIFLP